MFVSTFLIVLFKSGGLGPAETCEDKDLVVGQTKENKERFPNWPDRRSHRHQGTEKFLK